MHQIKPERQGEAGKGRTAAATSPQGLLVPGRCRPDDDLTCCRAYDSQAPTIWPLALARNTPNLKFSADEQQITTALA